MRGVCAVFLIATGCGHHVELRAPGPNLTPDQRVAAYNSLRGVTETSLIRVDSGQTVSRSMQLANGVDIRYADDVLPLVPRESEAARHARASQRARAHALWSELAAAAALVVGAYLVVHYSEFAQSSPNDAQKAGIGIAAVGGIGGMVLAFHFHAVATDEASATFNSYNDGLGETLNVCTVGLSVVPCENIAPPGPPGQMLPAPPDPATPVHTRHPEDAASL